MAVSVRLGAYLSLERAMLALDDAGDPMADALRDALDPLWYGLTDDDRVFLNRRASLPGPIETFEGAIEFLRLFPSDAQSPGNLTTAPEEFSPPANLVDPEFLPRGQAA